MRCPFCTNEELKVIDSRPSHEGNATKRRRECVACGRRFNTLETLDLSVQVHKRDGRFEDFKPQKLISGIEAACRHTRVSREEVLAIANSVTSEVLGEQHRRLETWQLGELVIKRLKALDPVAYIRFACVYRRFEDIDAFKACLKSLHSEERVEPCHTNIENYETKIPAAALSEN